MKARNQVVADTMNTFVPDILVILFGGICILLIAHKAWFALRSRTVLEQWAETNGYEILHAERRDFFLGPFFWTSPNGQTVYYVRVQDRVGLERSGWIRCGGLWATFFSEEAEVRWEEE